MVFSCVFVCRNPFRVKLSNWLNAFMMALLFTMWFLRLNERHSKIVNWLVKSVFSVYIVHQVPYFVYLGKDFHGRFVVS